MTDPEIAARRDLASAVAARAGAEAHAHWRNRASLAIAAKASPQDLVSEADRAVERLIRAGVAEAFPDDGFLGEELGHAPGRSGFTWVIDPIDGTAPFLHGMPNWCVSIGLTRGTETVAGVIDVPTHGEQFVASLGGGARLNGATIRIPEGLSLRTGITAIGASHRTDPDAAGAAVAAVLRAGGMFFRNGSGALMLAYVAAGRLAAYFEPLMHPWDSLAGLLIIREAGGRTAPFGRDGDPFVEDRVLAAAPEAWDDLVHLVG